MNKEHFGRAYLHNHTTHSDGTITPAQLLTSCQAVNADIFAVTDHNNIDVYWEIKELMAKQNIETPELIGGIEVTSPNHLLVLFPNDPFLIPALLGFERTVDHIFNRDGKAVIILPHPGKNPRFLVNPYTYIINRTHGIETLSPYNSPFGGLVARRYKELINRDITLAAISGGDNHFPFPYGDGWQYTTLFEGHTKEDFFKAAKEGKTIPITDKSIEVRRPTLEMTKARQKQSLINAFVPIVKEVFRSSHR